MRGHFITFEGVDGCGKTTQRKVTADWLRGRGMEVMETFEPGASVLGAELRRLLLNSEHKPAPETELMLFLADRAQHVHEIIQPALEGGVTVLCDRYTDSTRAYQLAGRKLDADLLEEMLAVAEFGVRPDLTLWFDLPVSEALQRMRGRTALGEVATRMDEECRTFHESVRTGFEAICRREPGRIRRIDAEGIVEEVQRRVREVISEVFGEPV